MTNKKYTIGTWCPIFSGFYESIWNDDITEDDLFNDGSKVKPEIVEHVTNSVFDYVDNDAYQTNVVTDFVGALDMPDGMTLTYEKSVSPQFYNYSTDVIYVKLEYTPESMIELKNYTEDNLIEFKEYLKATYTSVSGFISSYSNEYDDWAWSINELINGVDTPTLEHATGSLLNFYFQNEFNENNDYEMEIQDKLKANGLYLSQFINDAKLISDINTEFNLTITDLAELETE